jgi:hypothetical protein
MSKNSTPSLPDVFMTCEGINSLSHLLNIFYKIKTVDLCVKPISGLKFANYIYIYENMSKILKQINFFVIYIKIRFANFM